MDDLQRLYLLPKSPFYPHDIDPYILARRRDNSLFSSTTKYITFTHPHHVSDVGNWTEAVNNNVRGNLRASIPSTDTVEYSYMVLLCFVWL